MFKTAGKDIRRAASAPSSSKQEAGSKRPPGAKLSLNQILRRKEDGSAAPISFSQQRLWFVHQLDPGGAAYNEPTAVRLTGPLDIQALDFALQKIHERHNVLGSAFPAVDGAPVQVPVSHAPKCRLIDLSGAPENTREKAANELLTEEASQPFDIAKGPVARYTVVRLAAEDHILLVVMHHIVTDGWSIGLFFRELELFYRSFRRSWPAELPEPPIRCSDFSAWQHQAVKAGMFAQSLAFWKSKLTGAPPLIDLPKDCDRTPSVRRIGDSRAVKLARSLCQQLTTQGRSTGTTFFMFLMAAVAMTLGEWSGQEDLVIGTVAAGRGREELLDLIGCFINFLPIRIRVPVGAAASRILGEVRGAILESYSHQDCPFDKIVEATNPSRSAQSTPLYNTAVVFHSLPKGVTLSDGLSGRFISVETKSALLDLRFIAEESSEGTSVRCEYDTALFRSSTIESLVERLHQNLQTLAGIESNIFGNGAPLRALVEQAAAVRARQKPDTIAVAATFTADPIEESIGFWFEKLEMRGQTVLAPYNQVLQQLMDPGSAFNQNRGGLNVIITRLQDWHTRASNNGGNHIDEFITTLKAAASRSAVPYLLCVCPETDRSRDNWAEEHSAFAQRVEGISGVHVLTAAEILRLYSVKQYADAAAERLGSVPYTPEFFAALGTAVVRKFHALKRRPRKVIALDCDQTLWQGVCGEDGPEGIQLDTGRKALQDFMKRQMDSGMLLCLCTKNNEEDIAKVFQCRAEFPLRREDFVTVRANWESKSENLKSIARELNLSPDSFIFVDDNPVECAEVEANCPDVLVLQLPEEPARLPTFLDHVWIFDRLKVTDEDRTRTTLYKQGRQREELRAQCKGMAEFLASLNLNIRIEGAQPEHFERISQLTLRTNQFNFTTRRYTETEIQQIAQSADAQLLAVSVSDRFGDYGLVGVVIARGVAEGVDLETFLLSCRVLGKGVEHRMLQELGKLAQTKGAQYVNLQFQASPRNRPAQDFLEKTAGPFRDGTPEGAIFRVPTRIAAAIQYNPEALKEEIPTGNATDSVEATPAPEFKKCRTIALEAHNPEWIFQAVESWAARRRAAAVSCVSYVAPRTRMERELCGLWAGLLGLERVGVRDDFFALGGTSLLAVRLFAEIEKQFGKALPLIKLFECPTVEKLAGAFETQSDEIIGDSALVPIQTRGSRPPLILVHGAGGGILWGYTNLATHLGQDQPVFAIEPRDLGHADALTVEEMAAKYVADLRAFQPSGPYYLGGYCFGGYVAYEMARQLHAAGACVAVLTLIDSTAPNGSYERMRWADPIYWLRFVPNACYWLLDFLRLTGSERRKFVTRKLRGMCRKVFSNRAKSNAVDVESYIDTSQFPTEELKLWQFHLNAGAAYHPKPYPGRVTLLRTRGQPFFCSLDPMFGWSELAQDGVEVRIVSGSHENIFIEPDVRVLAAQVAACLRQSR